MLMKINIYFSDIVQILPQKNICDEISKKLICVVIFYSNITEIVGL